MLAAEEIFKARPDLVALNPEWRARTQRKIAAMKERLAQGPSARKSAVARWVRNTHARPKVRYPRTAAEVAKLPPLGILMDVDMRIDWDRAKQLEESYVAAMAQGVRPGLVIPRIVNSQDY